MVKFYLYTKSIYFLLDHLEERMGVLVKAATAWERFILHDLTTFARYAKVWKRGGWI